jgi:hypothetical protein
MDGAERLLVRVDDDLVLDAGRCETVRRAEGIGRVVSPPDPPLFRQVLEYLRAKPDPKRRPCGPALGREGVAAAAVTLRWGSYFAVLADGTKPLWDAVHTPSRSRISEEEMARINLEASSAMAQWIDLYRSDPGAHARLVDRALAHLPMPTRTAKPRRGAFQELSDPEHARRLEAAAERVWGAAQVARARADVARYATRVLANAAVNVAWRNGEVEEIHSGWAGGFPLDRRRVTPEEERRLLAFASEEMAGLMEVCRRFAAERPERSWAEQVLPYALGKAMLVTPTGWSLTEVSREVRLYPLSRGPA